MKFEDVDIYRPYNLNLVYGYMPHDAVKPIVGSGGAMEGTSQQLMPLGIRVPNTLGEIMMYAQAGSAIPAGAYSNVKVDIVVKGDPTFIFTLVTGDPKGNVSNAVAFYKFSVSDFGWIKLRIGVKAISPTMPPHTAG